jgi:phosphate uptake regulator
MDMRRIQGTGGTSYTVTLPKEWILSQNITKNELVGILTQPDGTLIITPMGSQESTLIKKTVNLDSIQNTDYLFRLLVSLYISGYQEIEIRSEKRISADKRETVARFLQKSIGPETINETDTSIVLHDLLDPAEMPFDKTVRRMYFLVKSMHVDAISAIIDNDKNMLEDIISEDREVDRLYWLTSRQYNIVSKQAKWLTKMKITHDEATFYFVVSKRIERIGDHAVIIAKNGKQIGKVKKEIKDELKSVSDKSLDVFKKSLDSWFKKDIIGANNTMDQAGGVISLCDELDKFVSEQKNRHSLALGRIIEGIRRTAEYSIDISELVMDHLAKRI